MPTNADNGHAATDLPSRLRAHLMSFRYFGDHALADLINQSAAEIERLQSALDSALAAGLVQTDEARLREGLEALMTGIPSSAIYWPFEVEVLRDLLARPTTTEETP